MVQKPVHLLSLAGVLSASVAFLAAACCVLPIALVALGLGGAWLSLLDLPLAYREDLQISSLVLLGSAWAVFIWRQYRRNSGSGLLAPDRSRTLFYLLLGTGLIVASFVVWEFQGWIRSMIVGLRS
tara:strand:+ start:384 stop:761 length:378 start_codon:yes stop_codon:yes gene_type:complete